MRCRSTANLNLPVFFGLAEGNPGYDEMAVTVYAQTDAAPDVLQEIYDKAVGLSPVLNTVQRGAKITTTLAAPAKVIAIRIDTGTRQVPDPREVPSPLRG